MADAIAWIGSNHRRTLVLEQLKDKWFCRLQDAGSLGVGIGYGPSADAAAAAAMKDFDTANK